MSFSDSGSRATLVDHSGAHPRLDALDEDAILGADLRVERERLLDPGVVRVLGDEVVEEAVGLLRLERHDRTDREVRPPWHDVDDGAGEEEVELAALDLARRVVCATRLSPRRAVLGHAAGVRLEEIRVHRDVHHGGESRVRRRAVVALEEVLRGDLPVAGELRLRALQEPQCVQVDPRVGDPLRYPVEELVERTGVHVRVHEDQGAPRVELQRQEAELVFLDPALLVSARRGDEAAVEAVGPGVVGALQRLASARSLRTRSSRDDGRRSGTRATCPRDRERAPRGCRRRAWPRTIPARGRRRCGRRIATSGGRCARARAGARQGPCTSSTAGF